MAVSTMRQWHRALVTTAVASLAIAVLAASQARESSPSSEAVPAVLPAVFDHNEEVLIDAAGAVFAVNGADIVSRGRQAVLRDVFATRLAAVADDPATCVSLADWALKNDLTREHVMALRTALLTDRRYKPARKLLSDYRRRSARLPYNDAAAGKMLADIGDGFSLLRTEHFRICYNCSAMYARITAELIERVYGAFVGFFEARYLEPVPISDRMEVILFDRRDQFRQCAHRFEPQMAQSGGFYASTTDRSYFYDAINDSEFADNKDQLLHAQRRLEQTRLEVESNRKGSIRYVVTAPDGSERQLKKDQMLQELTRQEDHLQQQWDQLRTIYDTLNINVTVHETTHQLSYNCGIFSRYYDNPTWLIEALAMYFEAAADQRWTTPGKVHSGRLETFLANSTAPDRVTLDELLADDNLFDLNSPRVGPTYAAAWALFYYLARRHHEALFDYLFDISLRISDQPYDTARRYADFEKYFGDRHRLEHHWHRFMADISP